MDVSTYTQLLGAIVTNLQALESVLRYFSMGDKAREVEFPKIGATDALENSITTFIALNTLVDQYNRALKDEEQDFKLDRNVIQIRDAIAHGRLMATEQPPPFRLWKFGRPKNGRVPVEFCQELTEVWLTSTRDMIEAQKQKVVDCFIARGYKGLR